MARSTTALTVQQVKRLADECGKYGLLVRFLALTGMRINEALALRVEDIDTTKSSVHVSRTWTHRKRKETAWPN